MTSSPYLTCHNLSLSYGPTTLFSELSFAVHPGERWGIVGPNGAGKSSLLKLIAGKITPDTGTVSLRKDLRFAVVEQTFLVDENLSISQILHGAFAQGLADSFDDFKPTPENCIASALKLSGLSAFAEKRFAELSGGQQKRIQLLSILLQNPQLILLDEPTNHLDIETVEWLEDFLLKVVAQGNGLFGFRSKNTTLEPCAYVIVSHDRALLDTLVNKVLEIENGTARSYEGNYEQYMQQKLERLRVDEKRQEKAANLLKRELAWLKTGAKARTTKQTARIKRAVELDSDFHKSTRLAQQRAKVSSVEFIAEISTEVLNSEDRFVSTLGNLGQQELLQIKNLSFKIPHPFAHNFWIFKDLNLLIKPKMRIALLGPNGCGKSTLMNLIMQNIVPTAGNIFFHENIKISYFDQKRHNLQEDLSVRQSISREGDFVSLGGRSLHVVSYLERFLFQRLDLHRSVKELSGGEQARLLLAKLMLEKGNVLLLDEPTNDLDIQTLQVLEKNLINFEGAILFTSHDRYFVQRCATQLLTYGGVKKHGDELCAQWRLCPDLEQALDFIEASRQEEKELERKNKETEKNKEESPLVQKDKKQKISFKEQREFELLESSIPKMEETLKRLAQELDGAYAQGKSYVETGKILEEIQNLEAQLKTANERWEEIFLKL